MSIKSVKQAINAQWQAMINAGRIPVIEYKLNNGDWLAVDIEYKGDYFLFSFDQDNKPVFFDGSIITGDNGFYRYPLDECFESLDHYLQEIHQNIIEGFFIPNNLYCADEEE